MTLFIEKEKLTRRKVCYNNQQKCVLMAIHD